MDDRHKSDSLLTTGQTRYVHPHATLARVGFGKKKLSDR